MKIAVTGGTGHVGACVVAALVEAGHSVRLLARRPAQVRVSTGPWGVPAEAVADVVQGDVTDEATVRWLLEGCDAVVHAAAVYALDVRRHEEMLSTNARAAELVLGLAAETGLDPVVHISSTVALTRFGGSGPDLPLGDLPTPYARSKIASEQVARRLQDEGHPVVCVYPGSVFGPHDPYHGDQTSRLVWQATGRLPLMPRGGVHSVDVRTVASVVAAVIEEARGPRRYVVPGTHADARLTFATLSHLLGRRRPVAVMPAPVARAVTRATVPLSRVLPEKVWLPTDPEGVEILIRDTRMDDGPARDELAVIPPSFDDTLRDTLIWMVDAGRLPARLRPHA